MMAMSLTIDTFVTGPLEVNTYVLRSRGKCSVVDPGSMFPDRLTHLLTDERIVVGQIWLTHGHGDHIAGVGMLKKMFPAAAVHCSAGDAEMLTDAEKNLSTWYNLRITAPPADVLIRPGDPLTVGDTTWQVLATGGHTLGGISFYCPAESVVLTGDALFAGGIGKTEIPGGDLACLLGNIHGKLMRLPDDTRVLPGHGPESTIGNERRNNSFLRIPTV